MNNTLMEYLKTFFSQKVYKINKLNHDKNPIAILNNIPQDKKNKYHKELYEHIFKQIIIDKPTDEELLEKLITSPSDDEWYKTLQKGIHETNIKILVDAFEPTWKSIIDETITEGYIETISKQKNSHIFCFYMEKVVTIKGIKLEDKLTMAGIIDQLVVKCCENQTNESILNRFFDQYFKRFSDLVKEFKANFAERKIKSLSSLIVTNMHNGKYCPYLNLAKEINNVYDSVMLKWIYENLERESKLETPEDVMKLIKQAYDILKIDINTLRNSPEKYPMSNIIEFESKIINIDTEIYELIHLWTEAELEESKGNEGEEESDKYMRLNTARRKRLESLKKSLSYYKDRKKHVELCKNSINVLKCLNPEEEDESSLKVLQTLQNLIEDDKLKDCSVNEFITAVEEVEKLIEFASDAEEELSLRKLEEQKVKSKEEEKKLIKDVEHKESEEQKQANNEVENQYANLKYLREEKMRNFKLIISAMTDAEALIEFTKKLKAEDIENLKHAAPEYSESLVSKGTVFDFSYWCKFYNEIKNNSSNFFLLYINIVSFLVKEENKNMSNIIKGCTEQIYALDNFYKELTQGGESKKTRALNIVKSSNFTIEFNKKEKKWEIEINYDTIINVKTNEENKEVVNGKKVIPNKLLHSDIITLKDQILLSTNVKDDKDKSKVTEEEKKKTSDLIYFTKLVDQLESIIKYLLDLYGYGYPDIKKYKLMKFVCKDGTIDNKTLKEFAEAHPFDRLKKSWTRIIKEMNKESYCITFLHGRQLWVLEKFFSKNFGKDGKRKNRGKALLEFMGKSCDLKKLPDYEKFSPTQRSNDEAVLEYHKNYPADMNPLLQEEKLYKIRCYLDKIPSISSSNIQLPKKVKNSCKIIYVESEDIIKELFTIYENTKTPFPLAPQLLFCTKSTVKSAIRSFIWRAIKDEYEKLYTIVNPERLDKASFKKLYSYVDRLSSDELKACGYHFAFLISDSESQKSKDIKTYLCDSILKPSQYISKDELKKKISRFRKHAQIVKSEYAGMGKTQKALEIARDNGLIPLCFPITGEIKLSCIASRLSDLFNKYNPTDVLLIIQLDNINDSYKLTILLYQLIVVKCFTFNEGVVNVDQCRIILEFANNIDPELISCFDGLDCEVLPKFDIKNYKFTARERYICYYLKRFYDSSLGLETEFIKLDNSEKALLYDDATIPDSTCAEYLGKYISRCKGEIDGFISFETPMKVLNYYLSSLAAGVFEPSLKAHSENPYLKDIMQDIKVCIMETIIKTTDEYMIKIVNNVRELQEQTRKFLLSGDSAAKNQLDILTDDEKIIGWDTTDHFVLLVSTDGALVLFYKNPKSLDTDFIGKKIKKFIYFNMEIEKPENITDSANLIKSISDNTYELADLTKLNHDELFDMLQKLKRGNSVAAGKGEYVLTIDNTLKMGLIYVRANAGIPVIIMGETGCGKTALVRFLATKILGEVFVAKNIHAGVEDDNIIAFMKKQIEIATKCRSEESKDKSVKRVWIFFDEFNTTNSIGLLKEIICDRRMLGEILPDNLVFIAACNPYRLKKSVLDKDSAGISKEILEGSENKYKLEHTVNPLPDTMLEYVWNFGSLTQNDEKTYIESILKNILEPWKEIFVKCVAFSQTYYKEMEGPASTSLREVRRFCILYDWFMKDFKIRSRIEPPRNYERKVPKLKIAIDDSYRAGLLSLIFCYYIRVYTQERRENYLEKLLEHLPQDKGITSIEDINILINREHQYLIRRMKIPVDIALNMALKENLYTMFVCVMNRIPLFVIGSPGCSKSLAIQLLVKHLRGISSNDPYFRELEELFMMYFQGSTTTTSEGILEVFKRAKNYHNSNKHKKVVVVIVFDEIGLAELSTSNPLKVLHSELEIDNEKDFDKKERIAFLANSNWRLDSSKMNRAIYLERPEPTEDDLVETAKKIYKSITNSKSNIDEVTYLVNAYYKFKEVEENSKYYGLRDFYGMIKYFARQCTNSENKNNSKDDIVYIVNSIVRNFGYLSSSFSKDNLILKHYGELSGRTREIEEIKIGNVLEFIKDNLTDDDSRYLMLIGAGDIPSYILEHKLSQLEQQKRIMVGSTFRNDKSDRSYTTRALHNVITLIGKDMTLAFKEMDCVYSSLYDLFNQNFTHMANMKYCKVAIGAEYTPHCEVNKKFHAIVYLDESKLNITPPPFLNRFEKHYLSFKSIMEVKHILIYKELKKWANEIIEMNKELPLMKNRIFINYSKDLFKVLAIRSIEEEEKSIKRTIIDKDMLRPHEENILNRCKEELIKLAGLELQILIRSSEIDSNNITHILGLYKKTHHQSFNKIIERGTCDKEFKKMIIYTYSPMTDKSVQRLFPKQIVQKIISVYHDEVDLNDDLKNFYSSKKLTLLVFDFDMQIDTEHIPFIKATLENAEEDYRIEHKDNMMKNVCFIMHIKKDNDEQKNKRLVFFEGWDSLMIDDIFMEHKFLIDYNLFGKTTNQLITEEKVIKIENIIIESLEQCFLSLKYVASENITQEDMYKIRTSFIKNIPKDNKLLAAIEEKILNEIKNSPADDWKVKIYQDSRVIASSDTTMDIIRNYLTKFIEGFLLRVLYALESKMALFSYFYKDSNNEVDIKEIWLNYFKAIKVNSETSMDKLIETTEIKYCCNLLFPFSMNEYKIYKKCYTELRPKEGELFYHKLSEFTDAFKEQSLLKLKDSIKLEKTPLLKLYMNDMITQFLFDSKLDIDCIVILEDVVEKALSHFDADGQIFFLFYYENLIREFLRIISHMRHKYHYKKMTTVIIKFDPRFDESLANSDGVLFKYMAELVTELCKTFMFSLEHFEPSDYEAFLEKLHIKLTDFYKACKEDFTLRDLIKFLLNYYKLFKLTGKEEKFPEIFRIFSDNGVSNDTILNVDFFISMRNNIVQALENASNAKHGDMLCKFLSEQYFNIIKVKIGLLQNEEMLKEDNTSEEETKAKNNVPKESNVQEEENKTIEKNKSEFEIIISHYLLDFNKSCMWKFSYKFFALFREDLNMLYNNLLNDKYNTLNEFKQLYALKIMEKNLKGEIEKNYFAICLSDYVDGNNTLNDNDDHDFGCTCKDCCENVLSSCKPIFDDAYKLLRGELETPLPELYRIIASLIFRQYLDAFVTLITKSEKIDDEVKDFINSYLAEYSNVTDTIALYCCKKIFFAKKCVYSKFMEFITSNAKSYPWMNRYLIKENNEDFLLNEKFPMFLAYRSDIAKLSTELYRVANGELKEEGTLIMNITNYFKEDKSIVVFMTFLRVTYNLRLHNRKLADKINNWLKDTKFVDVPDLHISLLKSIADNFNGKELFSIQTDNEFRGILLTTIIIISASIRKSPISCFFEDKNLNNVADKFKEHWVTYASKSPYLKADKTEHLSVSTQDVTLYQCQNDSNHIYYVNNSDESIRNKKCEKCGNPLERVNSKDQDKNNFEEEKKEKNEKIERQLIRAEKYEKLKEKPLNIKEDTNENLDPMTYQLLNLFVLTSTYYISKKYDEKLIKTVLDMEDIQVLEKCIEKLVSVTCGLINDSNNELVMRILLTRFTEMMVSNSSRQNELQEGPRFVAELNEVIQEVNTNLIQAKADYLSKLTTTAALTEIIELLSEKTLNVEKYPFISLMRIVDNLGTESLELFKSRYNSFYGKDKFKLIGYYMQESDVLAQLELLYPLIKFTTTMIENCSNQLTRKEAAETMIHEFLKINEHKDIAVMYERLIELWKRCLAKLNKSQFELPDITKYTYVKDFLLEKEGDNGTELYNTIKQLIKSQNEVLAEIYIKKDNMTAYQQLLEKKVKVSDLTQDKTINIGINDDFVSSSIPNPKYGMGSEALYDFELTETKIYSHFINAAIIDIESIGTAVYSGETLNTQNKLLIDVGLKIPQEELEISHKNNVNSHFDKKKVDKVLPYERYLQKLYRSFETILRYAKDRNSQGYTVEKFCKEFINNKNSISDDLHKPSPLSNISMKNVVHLFEIVEENYFPHYKKSIAAEYRSCHDKDFIVKAFEDLNKKSPEVFEPSKKSKYIVNLYKFLQCLIMRRMTNSKVLGESLVSCLKIEEYWPNTCNFQDMKDIFSNISEEIVLSDTFILYAYLGDTYVNPKPKPVQESEKEVKQDNPPEKKEVKREIRKPGGRKK